jgi:hypothetical protein
MKLLRTLFTAVLLTFVLPPIVSAADLTITASSFLASPAAKQQIGPAGAAVTIGQPVYFDATSATWKLADANASAATATVLGIAGSAAAIGQQFIIITEDPALTLGATLSMTAPIYCLSGNAGGIAPVADLTTGWYPSVILIATSTTRCIFKPAALRGTAAAQ